MNMLHKATKYLFQDNTGKYVIGQPPNVLVYVMAISFVAQLVATGKLHTFFDLVFFGSAFAWSYLEIRFGESMIRRIMGVIVLVTIFVSGLR